MRRQRVTVTLTLMPGSEPWIRVTHPKGWFKVPAETSLLTALNGAVWGWEDAKPHARRAPARVSVDLAVARAAGIV